MGDWQDFPLPDGSYSDSARPWSQQDIVNLLPTFAEAQGTRSRVKYAVAPGLHSIGTIGVGPHRGARDVEGRLFIVSGTTLYQLAANGVATALGAIPGTGPVSITHNQIDSGNQVVIGVRDNTYVYSTVTGTLTATGVGLLSVDFLNQYVLGVDHARRFWRWSGLADALTYSTIDNESAESSPDRIVGGIVSQGEWLVFGERTIEVWANNPSQDATFVRNVVIERGCRNANTLCRLDNSVFFVDNNGIPCRLQGYSPVPIAPKAIIDEIASCDPRKLSAFTWEDRGYVVYYITAQDGRTWGYDVTSQKWHRRESFGLDRWRLNTLFKWNGAWYGGDYSNGTIYKLVWGYAQEGGGPMSRRLRSGVLHNNGNRAFIHGFKLDIGAARSFEPPEFTEIYPYPLITDTLAASDQCLAYSETLTIIGGKPGFTYSGVSAGALPTGATVNVAGSVVTVAWASGRTPGTYSFTLKFVDDMGSIFTSTHTVEVHADNPVVDASYAIGGNTAAMTLSVPTGARDGDLLVMACTHYFDDGPDTGTAGWTVITNAARGTGWDCIAYKPFDGETVVTFTKSSNTSPTYAAALLVLRGTYVNHAWDSGVNPGTSITKSAATTKIVAITVDTSRPGDSTPPADFVTDTPTTGTWTKRGISYFKNGTETFPQIQVWTYDCPMPAGATNLTFFDAADMTALIEVAP